MKDKALYIVKHPALWGFLGTLAGVFCPKCTPWVQMISGVVIGS
jgi:hypothetical protein